MRVAVCLFGVIARSIRLTWPSVEKHLLLPLLRDGHVVELFGFNLNFNYAIPVDGVILNASGLSVSHLRAWKKNGSRMWTSWLIVSARSWHARRSTRTARGRP